MYANTLTIVVNKENLCPNCSDKLVTINPTIGFDLVSGKLLIPGLNTFGQACESFLSQWGPFHHNFEVASPLTSLPRDAKSAGLSVVET